MLRRLIRRLMVALHLRKPSPPFIVGEITAMEIFPPSGYTVEGETLRVGIADLPQSVTERAQEIGIVQAIAEHAVHVRRNMIVDLGPVEVTKDA